MKLLRPFCLGFAALLAATSPAFAAPEPWGINFMPAASPVMERIEAFHNLLLPIIIVISVFVLLLLAYVVLRFNARANPVPNRFAHNTTIEIIWTVIPIIILIVIAVPSFQLLYYGAKPEKVDFTIKAIGHQWYWSYEYPDHGNVTFDSRAIWDAPTTTPDQAMQLIKEVSPNWLIQTPQPLRMLEVDNRIVLPIGKSVRIITAATDVIHAWAMPELGVKKDAVPGRLNETWLRVDKPGVYYGQCSEICGTGHGYMPIVIEAVSQGQFDAWVQAKQPKTAALSISQ